MEKVITAKEARYMLDNEIGRNLRNLMSDIKSHCKMGFDNCQTRFSGEKEQIDKDIEKVRELGYNIESISEINSEDRYIEIYITIKW